jgi:two-component system, LytTR family, response regulator
MIKVVIIDDEINSRELLHNMLTNHCENVEVLGMAKDVRSGIEIIQQTNPQLVFLDIEMPGGNGFDILKAIENIDFKVVFVTGYDQYAIKAIKYAALDYILKPVDLDELKSALEKAKLAISEQGAKIRFLESAYKKPDHKHDQIIISSHNNHNIINLKDILYLEAMDGFSIVVVEPNLKHTSTHPLNYYEEILPADQFFRIHKSHLINCKKVTGYDAGRGGNVSLSNNFSLPIATRRKPVFISFMNRLSS